MPAGKTFDGIVSTVDVFPTFAKAAGASVPSDLAKAESTVDGVDLLPFVKGEKSGHAHDTLCWQQRIWAKPNERKPGGPGYPALFYNLAIRSGDWKAIKLDQSFDGTNDSRAWELYDLSCDPAELNDLATEFPEKVKELSAAFFAWQKQMPKPVPPPAASETRREATMKPIFSILTALLLAPLAALHAVELSGAIQPVGLRTEYLTNPSGIDVVPPRLSWVLDSRDPTARSLRQTAYQVLVSSSAELLARNTGDLWDSGKVISDETVGRACPKFAGF